MRSDIIGFYSTAKKDCQFDDLKPADMRKNLVGIRLNRKGQWFEVEDQVDKRRKWNQQLAAYNHQNRMIFISARILENPKFEKILKH